MSENQGGLPTPDEPDRGSEPGEDRIDGILAATEEILLRDGYARLSMRAIAQECGISVGNLNYYFRRKVDLLRAMTDRVWRRYRDEIVRVRQGPFESPRGELEAVLRLIFKDLYTRRTTVFFPELWALANHADYAAEVMDRLYGFERGVFCELISGVRPDLGAADQERVALHISASIEGHTLFVGAGKRFEADRDVEDLAIDAYLQLVDGYRRG
ncbi:MAG: TetR/AcrR family transcriptional regulator [Myxococcota bacterium]